MVVGTDLVGCNMFLEKGNETLSVTSQQRSDVTCIAEANRRVNRRQILAEDDTKETRSVTRRVSSSMQNAVFRSKESTVLAKNMDQ